MPPKMEGRRNTQGMSRLQGGRGGEMVASQAHFVRLSLHNVEEEPDDVPLEDKGVLNERSKELLSPIMRCVVCVCVM